MANLKTLVNLGMWPESAKALAEDGRVTAAGSSITLNADAHAGGLVQLNTAAGSTVVLPASTGSGIKIRVAVSVLATSNSHVIKVANSTDIMVGAIMTIDTDTSDAAAWWATTSTSDTITLNRTTTGSVRKGEFVELQDTAAGFWSVIGVICVTGAPATPFSATVS